MTAFKKMHGIGNDFVLFDSVREPLSSSVDWAAASRHLCDRRFGIGSDGVILLEPHEQAAFAMRMFNPDGSESEMCGNGIRCLAVMANRCGYASESQFSVQTGAGVLTIEVQREGQVTVDMGFARLTRGEIGMIGDPDQEVRDLEFAPAWRGTAISMGNPHLVTFVADVDAIDIQMLGPQFERHAWFPNRTNVHFVQVLDRQHLVQRTWERGAGATLACGTGACAVAVAGWLTGRSERDVTVQLPGGKLQIVYAEDGYVWMTGPAETVFEGSVDLSAFSVPART